MKTNLQVTKISVAEMLQRPEREYNQSEWEKKVNRYAAIPNSQFYVTEKNEVYAYARFFVSYNLQEEGLLIFSQFDGYSSTLTNNGFCKCFIDEEGFVHKHLFQNSSGKEGYCANTRENRRLLKERVCSLGVMVSTCL